MSLKGLHFGSVPDRQPMKTASYCRAAVLVLTLSSFFRLCAQTNLGHSTVYWVSVTISPSDREKCLDQHPLLLVLNEDDSMTLNANKLTVQQIRPVFRRIFQTRSDKRVFLKPSAKLRYGKVVAVVRELKASDSEVRIVLLTPKLESAPCAPPIPVRQIQ